MNLGKRERRSKEVERKKVEEFVSVWWIEGLKKRTRDLGH